MFNSANVREKHVWAVDRGTVVWDDGFAFAGDGRNTCHKFSREVPMWVEELRIENIRCFDDEVTLRFARGDQPYKWVTFLSENGGGKSTALQALGLLLAGPEGAEKLLPRPVGWVRNEERVGKITARIHSEHGDPGEFGRERKRTAFGYSYSITGSKKVVLNNRYYSEPTIVPWGQKILSWLRQNAFPSKGTGWFAVGYGAFRRLTRSSQIIIPSLEPQARFTNFSTQFDEAEPLSAFERWMVYLDYRIAKGSDDEAKRQRDIGIAAINQVLPEGSQFHSVSSEGRILFSIQGSIVPTIALSDGYRSILALSGDMIWRLIQAFPRSPDPLQEKGVALIDELDIHLHPRWQRKVADVLRETFPNLQFIVATHSPFIAAGAGDDAITYVFDIASGRTEVRRVENVAAFNVDRILASDAFGSLSPFSPATERKIQRYDSLRRKKRRTAQENDELRPLLEWMEEKKPIVPPPEPGSLEAKIDEFLESHLDTIEEGAEAASAT